MVRMITGWVGLLSLTLCVVTAQANMVKIREDTNEVRARVQRDTQPQTVKDCTHIKKILPNAPSGTYTIQPSQDKRKFTVYCEMLKDGGWTVLQRRTGGQVSFNRDWKAYEDGFGNLKGEHWLGLSNIWALTDGKSATLRVDLWDFEGGSAYAQYQDFNIGNTRTNYKLHVGAYSGNAGDAIRGTYAGIDQNGYGFSTFDRDNDGCSPCIFGDIATNDCSAKNGGGWWFSRCGSANLHGDWHPGTANRFWASGLHWLTWRGPVPYSAKATRMMIKIV
ncbi:fibrinogen-like protein 1 [Colossoma macropomum]|uniref:fibrinogen-like protein 1 n=1 Tax=Colossoma macropomum TaxID=42526 RepID=UPI001863F53D|nr:fibrinogen-like protein 1 [Colossoma macropomum]